MIEYADFCIAVAGVNKEAIKEHFQQTAHVRMTKQSVHGEYTDTPADVWMGTPRGEKA